MSSADDPQSINPSATPAADPTALPVGLRLGHFVIENLIAQGDYGFVYQARDTLLARRVAIKEYFPRALCTRGPALQMQPRAGTSTGVITGGRDAFIEEARMLSRLEHPGLVAVLAAFEAHHTAYRVMPLYEGVTLAQARKERRHAPSATWLLGLLRGLLEPVEALHQAGVVHGFIHPEQVMLLPGDQPMLLGFGTARRALHAPLDHAFAPLEQSAMGGHLPRGPWTDLYSAAAVMWFFGTGHPPASSTERNGGTRFRAGSELATALGAQLEDAPLINAIERAMTLAPASRLQSVSELREALESPALSTPRPQAEPPAQAQPQAQAQQKPPERAPGPREREAVRDSAPLDFSGEDDMDSAVRDAIARAVNSIPPREQNWRPAMPDMAVARGNPRTAAKVEPGLAPKAAPASRQAAPSMAPPMTAPLSPPMPPAMSARDVPGREAFMRDMPDPWQADRPQATALMGRPPARSGAWKWVVSGMVVVIGAAAAWQWTQQQQQADEQADRQASAAQRNRRAMQLDLPTPSTSTSTATANPRSAATPNPQVAPADPDILAQQQMPPAPTTQSPPQAPQAQQTLPVPDPTPASPPQTAPAQGALAQQAAPARTPAQPLPASGDLNRQLPPTATGRLPAAQSTVTEAKTAAAAPAVTEAPRRAAAANPPAPRNAAPTRQAAAAAAAPADPRDMCRGRANFSLLYCVQTACAKPQYSGNPTCIRVRRTGEVN